MSIFKRKLNHLEVGFLAMYHVVLLISLYLDLVPTLIVVSSFSLVIYIYFNLKQVIGHAKE